MRFRPEISALGVLYNFDNERMRPLNTQMPPPPPGVSSQTELLFEACACVTHLLLREEVKVVNYTTLSHGFHLSHKTFYNLHLSYLIGTDSLCNCSAWWCGPSYISHCLVTLSVWLERLYMFLSFRSRDYGIYAKVWYKVFYHQLHCDTRS